VFTKEFHSFLIIEGDTDRNFYKRLTDTNKCQITLAYSKSTALHLEQLHFLKAVKNKSQRLNIADTQLEAYIRDLRDDTHDPWHVCCGHDLVCILSAALRKTIGTWNPNDIRPDSLERSLRLAFERSYFYKTQLYLSIQQWEKANMPFVILVSG
jgi:hypothetical protein